MKRISIKTTDREYEILVGRGLLGEVGKLLGQIGFQGIVVIITDELVKKLHSGLLVRSIKECGYSPVLIEVPRGESYKSLEMAGVLYNRLAENFADRGTPILAMGGGVIGDLSGFVAATYMRGVPFIQVPTTLLAQVDSSIGGKVAVNHGNLKNMIGSFYQPVLGISDISVLSTLDSREISNGVAEIIKTALISDADFFDYLEKNISNLLDLNDMALEYTVYKTASIKASIVEKDEKDTGLRNVLNFGHTVGHALETVSNFNFTHGQAVSIGMVVAGEISIRLGMFNREYQNRLINILQKANLPVDLPPIDVDRVLEVIKHDKKMRNGKLKFILLSSIGSPVISDDITPEIVREALELLYRGERGNA